MENLDDDVDASGVNHFTKYRDFNSFMSVYTAQSSSPVFLSMNGHLSSDMDYSPGNDSLGFDDNSRNSQFCTGDNVGECLHYLYQEISNLGLRPPGPMNLTTEGKVTGSGLDVVGLVNVLYELVQRQRRASILREEVDDRQRRTDADIAHLQQQQLKLKAALEANERDLAAKKESERQLITKNDLLTSRLKMANDENRRLEAVARDRDTQYRHDVRKKERELVKLKERLHALISDRTKRATGLDLSQPVTRLDGKRGTWQNSNKQEEEMYRSIIGAYEDRQKELMLENAQLRMSLQDTHKELEGCVEPSVSSQGLEDEDSEGQDETDTDQLSEAHYQMPYNMVRSDIEKSLRDRVKQLKNYIKHMENNHAHSTNAEEKSHQWPGGSLDMSSSTGSEERSRQEVEQLQGQIRHYREVIEQQENLLQQFLDSTTKHEQASDSALQFSGIWDEKESLDNERKFFEQQKENFEKERKSFTEAAVRLAKEKMDFEAKKMSFLQNQFLQITPFKDERDKSFSQIDNLSFSKHLFSTPSRTPKSIRKASMENLKSHSDSGPSFKTSGGNFKPSPLVKKSNVPTLDDTWIITGEINTQVEKVRRNSETQTVSTPGQTEANAVSFPDSGNKMLEKSESFSVDNVHSVDMVNGIKTSSKSFDQLAFRQKEISSSAQGEMDQETQPPAPEEPNTAQEAGSKNEVQQAFSQMPQTMEALNYMESRLVQVLETFPDLDSSRDKQQQPPQVSPPAAKNKTVNGLSPDQQQPLVPAVQLVPPVMSSNQAVLVSANSHQGTVGSAFTAKIPGAKVTPTVSQQPIRHPVPTANDTKVPTPSSTTSRSTPDNPSATPAAKPKRILPATPSDPQHTAAPKSSMQNMSSFSAVAPRPRSMTSGLKEPPRSGAQLETMDGQKLSPDGSGALSQRQHQTPLRPRTSVQSSKNNLNSPSQLYRILGLQPPPKDKSGSAPSNSARDQLPNEQSHNPSQPPVQSYNSPPSNSAPQQSQDAIIHARPSPSVRRSSSLRREKPSVNKEENYDRRYDSRRRATDDLRSNNDRRRATDDLRQNEDRRLVTDDLRSNDSGYHVRPMRQRSFNYESSPNAYHAPVKYYEDELSRSQGPSSSYRPDQVYERDPRAYSGSDSSPPKRHEKAQRYLRTVTPRRESRDSDKSSSSQDYYRPLRPKTSHDRRAKSPVRAFEPVEDLSPFRRHSEDRRSINMKSVADLPRHSSQNRDRRMVYDRRDSDDLSSGDNLRYKTSSRSRDYKRERLREGSEPRAYAWHKAERHSSHQSESRGNMARRS